MTALHDQIRAALIERSERWYDGLAPIVAAPAWASLARVGITPENYGTARVLRSSPTAPRIAYATRLEAHIKDFDLEAYDAAMLARYGIIGLREPKADFDAVHFEAEIARATRLIDVAPGAGEAVRALVRSLTPVDVEGRDYDTSYSDPVVPFSIFIGAHAAADQVPPIRLAEGVLHEAMHLQLSLMEDHVPLVVGNSGSGYSPWQDRQRPTQGLLHGMYVFRVIQDWLRMVETDPQSASDDVRHARARCILIDQECAQLVSLAGSEDLTADGRTLAKALRR